MDIGKLRKEYLANTLEINHLNSDPLMQLKKWVQEAIDCEILEPNAMVVATVNKEGRPSSRTILMKEIDNQGIIFYTNYESRKGRDLAENPFASLTIFWKELERQVTIDGRAFKIPEEHSIEYFSKRPRESQLGAWCSRQGTMIASRSVLEEAYKKYEAEFGEGPIPKPTYWGGYRLEPECMIFWQGREKRLHDRFIYTKNNEGEWSIQRLSP